jgi:hypothetical protein
MNKDSSSYGSPNDRAAPRGQSNGVRLTLKEQSRLRRLLRELARAKAKDWPADIEILEAEMAPLVEKMTGAQ